MSYCWYPDNAKGQKTIINLVGGGKPEIKQNRVVSFQRQSPLKPGQFCTPVHTAEKINVSERTVKTAKKVQSEELQAAVKFGRQWAKINSFLGYVVIPDSTANKNARPSQLRYRYLSR